MPIVPGNVSFCLPDFESAFPFGLISRRPSQSVGIQMRTKKSIALDELIFEEDKLFEIYFNWRFSRQHSFTGFCV